MKKMKYSLSLIIMLLVFLSAFPAATCLAASAKVELSAENSDVTVGDTVHIYINIKSSTIFTDFEANLTYDRNILEYQGGASVINGGDGYLKVSDMGKNQSDTSRKYALEFKALRAGSSSIVFEDQVMVYDDSGYEMPVSSASVTINVKAAITASTNANLKSLETSPVSLTPAFDKNIYEYNGAVGNEVQKLIISAIPEDGKAMVSIIGNDYLLVGENKIIITVLAESGDVIEYTINITREAAPTVTPLPTSSLDITEDGLKVMQSNGVITAIYDQTFTLLELNNDAGIPKGYARIPLTINEVTITAFAPVDNPESNLVLIYAVDSNNKANFYQYDKQKKTFQLFAPEALDNNQDSSGVEQAAVAIALLSTLCVLLAAIAIWLFLKLKRNKSSSLD